MWRKLRFVMFAMAVVALPLLLVNGCAEKLPTEGETEEFSQSVDDGSRQFYDTDDIGDQVLVSADLINAIGQRQHAQALADGKQGSATAWQLYVYVPFVSQNDSRWKNHSLGYNYDGRSTIGKYGCLLSCLTMHYKKWGYNIDPRTLNNWSKFGQDHYAFSTCCNGDRIHSTHAISYPNMSRPWRVISYDEIYPQLAAGRPVVMYLYLGNNNYHFVVIYGFDGTRYWCKDPWRTSSYNQPLFGQSVQARIYGYQ
ncbi:MAG: C39 family peptidase [bacterium]